MYSVNNCDDASIKQSEQAQKKQKTAGLYTNKKNLALGGGGGCMGEIHKKTV